MEANLTLKQKEQFINTFLNTLAAEFKFKKIPNLHQINQYLDYFKRPELKYKHRIIISGTAGKGTTAREVEKLLLQNNLTTTTLYSPHIQVVYERIRINGKLIDIETFYNILKEINQAKQKTQIPLSYYECLVLLGIIAGTRKQTDVLICEVGLGGDFDATNAIQGERISALTFVDLDHTEILGKTKKEIAEKKLGIVTKNSTHFLTYEQDLKDFIKKTSLIKPEFHNFKEFPNEQLGLKIVEIILNKNIKEIVPINLPCRFEKIAKNIILDGAHSKPRYENIKKKIKKIKGKKTAIIGILERHNYKELQTIIGEFDEIIWTKIEFIHPYHSPNKLTEYFNKGRISINPIKEIETLSKTSTVIVLGSFYLSGYIREHFITSKQIIQTRNEFGK